MKKITALLLVLLLGAFSLCSCWRLGEGDNEGEGGSENGGESNDEGGSGELFPDNIDPDGWTTPNFN